MGTVSGKYVRTFHEANMGMLDNVSLNAPYPFFWVTIEQVDENHIACIGGHEKMRLPFMRTTRGDVARVTMQDPIFGPLQFNVLPFLAD
ncbi:hypothetical protein [Sphingobium yanoikuyae]|uniref:hypothetical protein n=1 Tax=Sphingobium yanoikuyae TaxID=13690 RepID=UPI0035B1C99E